MENQEMNQEGSNCTFKDKKTQSLVKVKKKKKKKKKLNLEPYPTFNGYFKTNRKHKDPKTLAQTYRGERRQSGEEGGVGLMEKKMKQISFFFSF